jgi:serine O-acetyltransferase
MKFLSEKLNDTLDYEREIYSQYMFKSKFRFFLSKIKREPARIIYLFLVLSRKCDYYYYLKNNTSKIQFSLLYFYYVCRKNRVGERLGLEIGTENIGKGLMIFHYNVVINAGSIIGVNCHLHGDNCIGNDGKTDECPRIGDNVSLGVGAKVIGNVTIANNIKIAAGAVVVHSFLEEGITIGGVPAKKIK